MIAPLYILLVATALLGTAVVIYGAATGGVAGVEITPRTGLLVAVGVFVLWGLVGINAFEITTYSGGSSFTNSYPQLAWVAVAGGALMLYAAFEAALEEINASGGI